MLFNIQTNLNNVLNVIIDLIFNKLMYKFKIKNCLIVVFEKIDKKLMTKIQFNFFQKTQLEIKQKIVDAMFFENFKSKILYDKKHKLFMLKLKKSI